MKLSVTTPYPLSPCTPPALFPQSLVCTSAYILGEFGRLITPEVPPAEQFKLLYSAFPTVSQEAKGLLMTAFIKIYLLDPSNANLRCVRVTVCVCARVCVCVWEGEGVPVSSTGLPWVGSQHQAVGTQSVCAREGEGRCIAPWRALAALSLHHVRHALCVQACNRKA